MTRKLDPWKTESWVFNKSDEYALEEDCTFSLMAGSFAVWWIERYCTLYEGDCAGQRMILRIASDEPAEISEPLDGWDDEDPVCRQWAEERARYYLERRSRGGHCDWQYDFVARFFGWQRYSEHWNRHVRRFRTGCVWIPKKNKKSPTLAAVGLFLLLGDNEPGQHVYLGAKDGAQARKIAGEHAVSMMRKSPELAEQLRLNKNLMRIFHPETNSYMEPLSSANERTQQSKEGLNGSLLIDETHVVDRKFMHVVSRCGISRSEPVHLEFSTAGDDTNGYGFDRWKFTERVLSGELRETRHFGVLHAVPANVDDHDIRQDPVKYGKLANPSWGHTIDPEEFTADCVRSREESEREWRKFKQYRLNIWSDSPEIYLDWDQWQACALDFDWEDMQDVGGGCAIDLSRNDDFSSAVFVGKCSKLERVLCWPIIWLPEDTIQRYRDKVPLLADWGMQSYVRVIPGQVVDYDLVEEDMIEALKHTGARTICYDPAFATQLAQHLEKKARVTAAVFQQSFTTYAAPTDETSRLVKEGSLAHPNNPAFNWQVRNAETKEYAGKRKPVKDLHNPHKKIDAVQALVMAVHGYTLTPKPRRTSYNSNPIVYGM